MIHQIKTIYLAGPIKGLSYGDARHGWREEFAELMPEHIRCASPMRAKHFLSEVTNLSGTPDSNLEHSMSRPSGIVTRDRNDVRTSDAVVFNFLGASIASVGSCIEIGWADAFHKPSIMVIEKSGAISGDIVVSHGDGAAVKFPGVTNVPNPHWHCMTNEIMGYVVHDLEEAAHIVEHLLTPGI